MHQIKKGILLYQALIFPYFHRCQCACNVRFCYCHLSQVNCIMQLTIVREYKHVIYSNKAYKRNGSCNSFVLMEFDFPG